MDLEQQVKIAVEGCGVFFYDTTIAKANGDSIYRVYITSPHGVTLDKCQEVSRMISPILDISEPMRGAYRLEVSSPGIERKLVKKQHFIGSIGENIKGKGFSTNKFKGKLISYENNVLTFVDAEEVEFTLNYDDILKASTYYNW